MSAREIRLYEDRDFETTWRLFHRLSEHYGIGELPTEVQSEAHVRGTILGGDSDVHIVLAVEDGVAVALATFAIMYPAPNRKGQLYMKELFVDAAHRRRGFGGAILRFLARYAVEHGCNRVDWTTDTTNPGAMDLYAAIGARPVETKVYYRLADEELRSFAGLDE